MVQPTRVLPSNAPPLRDGSESTSRVLQEHSGNSQQIVSSYAAFGYATAHDQKYPASLLTENTYPSRDPNGQPLYPQHHRRSIQSLRCGVEYEGGANNLTAEEEAHIQHDAKVLWRQFLCSDGYAKYRQRQHKDSNKTKDDQKWPDDLERAFFHALVRWQPMGRRKYMWKKKLRGRNELIADYIEAVTGVERSRKQVSSHIQVLKPFVAEDPRIMRYLSKDDHGPRERHASSAHLRGYADGRQRSHFPVIAAPASSRPVLPHPRSRGQEDSRDDTDIFLPVEFEMFVQRKHQPNPNRPEDVEVQRLHTYTKQISHPFVSEERFTDWDSFAEKHPFLAMMHSQRPISTEVIAAEASLAMTNGTWSSKGVELGISFRCRSARLRERTDVMCSSMFCIDGQRFDDPKPTHQVQFSAVSNGDFEAQVNFGSSFWVKALSAGYREAGNDGPAFLKSITATQEISMVRHDGRQEKLLIIHWSFRKSSGECGRAFWRRVVLPPASSQYAPKIEAVDTPFNFNDMNDPLPHLTASTAPPQPALQSPFEYDDSSAGSALSSATWPSTVVDLNGLGINADCGLDNTFDFLGGNINFAYDANLNLDGFDTSTFNFDSTGDDYVADPNLEDYSQQTWDTYAGAFDSQQSFMPDPSFDAALAVGTQPEVFQDFNVYDPQMYGSGQEAQAFGGAGQDGMKEEDMIAALASADFAVQTTGQ